VEGIHAGDVDSADVMIEKAVQGRGIEQVAIGLNPEFGPVAKSNPELTERVEQQVRPDEHLATRENDSPYLDVPWCREVTDATIRFVETQSGRTGLGVVIAMRAPLVTVTRENPVDRIHSKDPVSEPPRRPNGSSPVRVSFSPRVIVPICEPAHRT